MQAEEPCIHTEGAARIAWRRPVVRACQGTEFCVEELQIGHHAFVNLSKLIYACLISLCDKMLKVEVQYELIGMLHSRSPFEVNQDQVDTCRTHVFFTHGAFQHLGPSASMSDAENERQRKYWELRHHQPVAFVASALGHPDPKVYAEGIRHIQSRARELHSLEITSRADQIYRSSFTRHSHTFHSQWLHKRMMQQESGWQMPRRTV